jgi:hypothetical protein
VRDDSHTNYPNDTESESTGSPEAARPKRVKRFPWLLIGLAILPIVAIIAGVTVAASGRSTSNSPQSLDDLTFTPAPPGQVVPMPDHGSDTPASTSPPTTAKPNYGRNPLMDPGAVCHAAGMTGPGGIRMECVDSTGHPWIEVWSPDGRSASAIPDVRK